MSREELPAVPGQQQRQAKPQCPECLAALIHRLSQPLTALRGTLELALLKERSAADYRCAVEQAFELANLLVRLITSLRALAESSTPSSSAAPVALDELVKEVVDELRGFTTAQGLEIIGEPAAGLYVQADRERLREVLYLALASALHRSSEKGVIRIALANSEEGARLTIDDPRTGSDLVNLDQGRTAAPPGHLFADAEKADALDWTLTQYLVAAMGGLARVESSTALGCRFCLLWPRADAPPAPSPLSD